MAVSATTEKIHRSSHPQVFLGKGCLKICNKFTGLHPCRSAISIKLLCNFIEIALRHGYSPANLPHIFRKLFLGTPLGGFLWIQFYWNIFLTYSTTVIKEIVSDDMAGTAVRRCSSKQVFLKFLQYSQKNTCVDVSFW